MATETREKLSYRHIDVVPVDMEWSEMEFGEEWDIHHSCRMVECEHCNGTGEAIIIIEDDDSGTVEECGECEGTGRVEGRDGDEGFPMMNYAYPISNPPDDVGALLDHLPLTCVEVRGQWFLALTGGGMDLSPEICAGYVALGYYPPVHFINNLWRCPDARVARACRESLRAMVDRAEWALKSFDDKHADKLAPPVGNDKDGLALRRAYLDSPDDETTRSAFADWLEETGREGLALKVRENTYADKESDS